MYPCEKKWRSEHRKQFLNYQKEYQKKYRKEHQKEANARKNDWRLPLASECELCPEDDKQPAIDRHHPDYNYPNIIVSVCGPCHRGIKQ